MDKFKIAKVLGVLKKEGLSKALETSIDEGDPAYRTNRAVLRAFDVSRDIVAGIKAAERLLWQTDEWIASLEGVRDGAKRIREVSEKTPVYPAEDVA